MIVEVVLLAPTMSGISTKGKGLTILERSLFINVGMKQMRTMVFRHNSAVVAVVHVDIY